MGVTVYGIDSTQRIRREVRISLDVNPTATLHSHCAAPYRFFPNSSPHALSNFVDRRTERIGVKMKSAIHHISGRID